MAQLNFFLVYKYPTDKSPGKVHQFVGKQILFLADHTIECKNEVSQRHHDQKNGESAVSRPLFAAGIQHVFDEVEIKNQLCARHLFRHVD
jgi:hypothetical protein